MFGVDTVYHIARVLQPILLILGEWGLCKIDIKGYEVKMIMVWDKK